MNDPTWNPDAPILGDWGRDTLRMDFDAMRVQQVITLCRIAMKLFDLGGFLVLESSPNHYYAVFDRRLSWEKNCQVMAWFGIVAKNVKVKDYVLMQIRKGSSTLRISSKGTKPSPFIVYCEGEQNEKIKSFLKNRQFIEDIRDLLKLIKRSC